MPTATDDDLDMMFAALADRTRRAIVAHLADGDRTVNELAEPFAISLQAVSKHIQVLERAGLVTRTVNGREHRLSINAEPLDAAAQWIEHHRQFWEQSLAALETFVMRKQRMTPKRSSRK